MEWRTLDRANGSSWQCGRARWWHRGFCNDSPNSSLGGRAHADQRCYSGVVDAQPVPRDPVRLDPAEVPSVLHYEKTGQGDPVILIQGANLPMQMWDEQVRYLSAELQVVRYDVRGFGGSGPRDSVPYQSHGDLRALLDYLGIERAHLVGLSLGGRIAVDFALTYPERVQSLVLADPG